jgi:glycosyltransferase involved in cell wall biosynthesis
VTRILYLLTDEMSSVLVRGQLGHLADNGFDVTVGTRRSDPHGGGASSRFDDAATVEHLPFVREPHLVADVRALIATARLIRRTRPDTVNASTPKAGLLGMLAARACRVPVRIYVMRGLRFETERGWRRRLLRGAERLAVRCATTVVANSRSLLAVAEREGVIDPGRGIVIGAGSGNGVDIARFADDVLPSPAVARTQLGLPLDAAVVGFVGRFTADKGIDDLVAAHRALLAPNGDVWLLLVGQFEDSDALAERTRHAIVASDRIMCVPWLDEPAIAYRAMDVLAFPSMREGLPNVPLEAQCCEVPVVGYGATGTVDAVVTEPIGDRRPATGVLVEVGDVAALASSLAALLADPDRRIALGRAGRRWVGETFRQDRLWDALAELSRPAVPPPARPR